MFESGFLIAWPLLQDALERKIVQIFQDVKNLTTMQVVHTAEEGWRS